MLKLGFVFSIALAGCLDYGGLSKGEGHSHEDEVKLARKATAAAPLLPDVDLAGPEDMAGLGDAASAGDGAITPTDGAVAPVYLASCAAVRAAGNAADGDFTLYVGGTPAKPWTAYCKGAKEYLTLTMTGSGQNFSQYTVGGSASGTTVRTNYQRVRVDPVTLKIDTSDQTFSTSTGTISQGSSTVASVPYAAAVDCIGASSATGAANVDLRGTPFTIALAAFSTSGYAPGGSSVYSQANQIATLTGGGLCGWTSAGSYPGPYTGSIGGPINEVGGFNLQIVYP